MSDTGYDDAKAILKHRVGVRAAGRRADQCRIRRYVKPLRRGRALFDGGRFIPLDSGAREREIGVRKDSDRHVYTLQE